jgi:galactokinase/mevalonate kinase-like predicted kinase
MIIRAKVLPRLGLAGGGTDLTAYKRRGGGKNIRRSTVVGLWCSIAIHAIECSTSGCLKDRWKQQ